MSLRKSIWASAVFGVLLGLLNVNPAYAQTQTNIELAPGDPDPAIGLNVPKTSFFDPIRQRPLICGEGEECNAKSRSIEGVQKRTAVFSSTDSMDAIYKKMMAEEITKSLSAESVLAEATIKYIDPSLSDARAQVQNQGYLYGINYFASMQNTYQQLKDNLSDYAKVLFDRCMHTKVTLNKRIPAQAQQECLGISKEYEWNANGGEEREPMNINYDANYMDKKSEAATAPDKYSKEKAIHEIDLWTVLIEAQDTIDTTSASRSYTIGKPEEGNSLAAELKGILPSYTIGMQGPDQAAGNKEATWNGAFSFTMTPGAINVDEAMSVWLEGRQAFLWHTIHAIMYAICVTEMKSTEYAPNLETLLSKPGEVSQFIPSSDPESTRPIYPDVLKFHALDLTSHLGELAPLTLEDVRDMWMANKKELLHGKERSSGSCSVLASWDNGQEGFERANATNKKGRWSKSYVHMYESTRQLAHYQVRTYLSKVESVVQSLGAGRADEFTKAKMVELLRRMSGASELNLSNSALDTVVNALNENRKNAGRK